MRRPMRSNSFVSCLKRCNRVADCHGGKTFLVVVLRSNREGSQVRSPSRPPSSPSKPQISRPAPKGPFLWGFSSVSFRSFGLLRSLRPISAARLCIQKFRSPAAGFRRPIPFGSPGMLGVLEAKKRHFESAVSARRNRKPRRQTSPQRHEVGSGHDRSGISVAALRQAGFIIANYLEPGPHTH